jgi:major membrane immunogen (membrane-anchored lipoprotein)
MKTKKIILVMLALIFIVSLSACGANDSKEQSNNEVPKTETTQGKEETFIGYSDATAESKGEAKVQITVKDGKITGVNIEEIQDGSKGHAGKDYATYSHKPAIEGRTYFQEEFTGLSSIEEVDSVDDFAGITSSSAKFKEAVKRALIKSGSEKSGTYFDGTFMGYSDTSAEKGFATAYVTIKNDTIESVVLQEWQPDKDKEGAFVLKDYATYPKEEAKPANDFFTKEFVGAKTPEDIDAIDDFAGVTHSSENYKEAVKMALEKAKK